MHLFTYYIDKLFTTHKIGMKHFSLSEIIKLHQIGPR